MSALAINGGTPIRSGPYPAGLRETTVTWPQSPRSSEEDAGAATRSRDRRPPSSRSGSPRTRGAEHGVLMANGSVTMEVALKALGIGWGDEVIVPALTFAATAYAPIVAGALPGFVDVTPATWTIDPDQVEAAITPRTRAILPVHLGHQWRTWTGSWRPPSDTHWPSSRTAPTPTVSSGAEPEPAASASSAPSATSRPRP
jgi:hypothetical protein